jgi:endo-1,4-beta-xylanase
VTPENGGKWGSVEGTRDVMNWTQADAAYALAKANGFKFKWHTFIWGNQQPAWIESLPTAEQREEIEEWYAAVAARYPDIDQIEVVNEPLHDPPRGPTNGNYIEALGGNGVTGWDWIITSFQLARQYFPNAELILNDYSITNDGNATTNYINIINLLKERGLIDAIGDQAHAFSTTEPAPMSNHKNNLNRLAATGLPIYITELDIDGVLAGVVNDPVQVGNFQRIFPTFWEHPSVKGVTIWGYVRGFHWRNAQGDWLLYPNGGERPALQWLIRYVQNAPASIPARQFTVEESVASGVPIGTVLATDADADTTFSQWQIASDPSGKFVIDASTGVVSLAAGASLDFEAATAHVITVTVWDGYTRSSPGTVTINVTNANDNAPVIKEGAERRIDGGYGGDLGVAAWFDLDDTNDPEYTILRDWKILSGNDGPVFRIDAWSGDPYIAHPLAIDWTRSSYVLTVSASDGVNTSAPATITIVIPDKVTMCVNGKQQKVPKANAKATLWSGGFLGLCRKPR